MFTEIIFDVKSDLDSNQFNWVVQLVNSFAYDNTYNVTISLYHNDNFSTLVIDGSLDLSTNMISIKGRKATMITLFEEFSDKFGAINNVGFNGKT